MQDNGGLCSAGEAGRQGLSASGRRESREGPGAGCGRVVEVGHHEEKLLDRIRQLNAEGVRQLQNGHHAQALLFFQECEATLEYAASCGKTIDRSLILAVLNNEAATHQRSQDHERAASYVEAIIYNLNLYLDSQQNRLLLARLAQHAHNAEKGGQECLAKADSESLSGFAGRKYELALYLLQFAGLQSQSLAHEQSLSNARKALQAVKELSQCSWRHEIIRNSSDGKSSDGKSSDGKTLALLEELSELPLVVDQSDYDSLRRQFERAIKNQQASSTMMGSEATLETSLLLERASFEEVFSLRPVQVDGEGEPSSACRTHPLSGEHGLQKLMLAVCGYFTMGAELQQLNGSNQQSNIYLLGPSESNHQGECYHLMALIIGHRHLPASNRFLQQLMGIYRETYNHSPISQHSFSQHLDHLTQKYKNYMMEKELSISLDDSEEPPVDPQAEARWNEEKKESKKLNELLKQDPVTNCRSGQENYFLEVPSIDSIEMATSLSNRNRTDNSAEDPPKRTKIHFHHKLKASRLDIDYEDSRIPLPPTHPTIPECPREEDRADSRRLRPNNNTSKKSKSKKGKSRGKLTETKKMEKAVGPTPAIGLMTTITERSTKKLKSKRSPEKEVHAMMGSAGVEQSRWAADPRKIISSEQFKPPKSSQFSSMKNFEQIRMNKVKGACKMGASATSGLHEMRSLQTIRLEKGSHQRSAKGKSKGKSSASFKSKKSHSNSSSKTPLKKHPNKTITPAKDKIYTSIKQTIRRR